jgi:alpha-beta hydrolase superfamily lysophospholipase
VTERWDVETSDGGTIAVWVDGTGPPLVLVHGSISDHTGFAPLIDELRDEVTTFAMDRRGFGASPDRPGYYADREFTDVAAVVSAVATRTGQRSCCSGTPGAPAAPFAPRPTCPRCGPRALRAEPRPAVPARLD